LHESGMRHIRARPKGEYLHWLLHFPWAQTVPFAAPPADAPFAFSPKALCSILKVYSCNMRAKSRDTASGGEKRPPSPGAALLRLRAFSSPFLVCRDLSPFRLRKPILRLPDDRSLLFPVIPAKEGIRKVPMQFINPAIKHMKEPPSCHSGLDPESRRYATLAPLDSRLRGNDGCKISCTGQYL
jgi:hypothetical protein